MTTNDFFDKVYCIVPTDDELSWEKTNVRFDAVDVEVEQVNAYDISSSPIPSHLLVNLSDLSELLSFYNLIRQASKEDIESFLVLFGDVIPCSKYIQHAEKVFDSFPDTWDVVYWGYKGANLRQPPIKGQVIYAAFSAKGSYALAINKRFYHLFLEETRVPKYNLDGHIHALSLAIQLFVVNPPLVSKA